MIAQGKVANEKNVNPKTLEDWIYKIKVEGILKMYEVGVNRFRMPPKLPLYC